MASRGPGGRFLKKPAASAPANILANAGANAKTQTQQYHHANTKWYSRNARAALAQAGLWRDGDDRDSGQAEERKQKTREEMIRERQAREVPKVDAGATVGPGVNAGQGRKKGRGKRRVVKKLRLSSGLQAFTGVKRVGPSAAERSRPHTLDGSPIHIPHILRQAGSGFYTSLEPRRNKFL